MKIEPRSLRTELPEPSEVRAPQPPDLEPGEMRLSAPRAPEPGVTGLPEAAPAVPAGGFEALAAVVGTLADEERDAQALGVLDDAGRARLAPQLSAVRDMAQAVEELLGLRREVTNRMRAGGRG